MRQLILTVAATYLVVASSTVNAQVQTNAPGAQMQTNSGLQTPTVNPTTRRPSTYGADSSTTMGKTKTSRNGRQVKSTTTSTSTNSMNGNGNSATNSGTPMNR